MDLVLQAAHLASDEVDTLVALTGAQGVLPLTRAGNDACRLVDVESDAGVAQACAAANYDVARIEADHPLAGVRLVAMDMDSTLITIECIDEIAAAQGIKPQVAAITARTMRGEIDFAESLRQRVALLAGAPASALADVYARRLLLSPGAERLLDALHAQGTQTLLLSGGFTYFTDRLRERLGFTASFANTLEIVDGHLTGRIAGPVFDARAKAGVVAQWAGEARRSGGIAVAIGDGANDIPMLEAADVSVAWHAKPAPRARALYAIDYCGLDAVLNLFT